MDPKYIITVRREICYQSTRDFIGCLHCQRAMPSSKGITYRVGKAWRVKHALNEDVKPLHRINCVPKSKEVEINQGRCATLTRQTCKIKKWRNGSPHITRIINLVLRYFLVMGLTCTIGSLRLKLSISTKAPCKNSGIYKSSTLSISVQTSVVLKLRLRAAIKKFADHHVLFKKGHSERQVLLQSLFHRLIVPWLSNHVAMDSCQPTKYNTIVNLGGSLLYNIVK